MKVETRAKANRTMLKWGINELESYKVVGSGRSLSHLNTPAYVLSGYAAKAA